MINWIKIIDGKIVSAIISKKIISFIIVLVSLNNLKHAYSNSNYVLNNSKLPLFICGINNIIPTYHNYPRIMLSLFVLVVFNFSWWKLI